MSAPHWRESGKAGFPEAHEKAQRPRLAAGHEFIGRRLLRFRRGGGDSKEKTSGRVRAVRDDPGRGRLFAVLWDDRPGVTEEVRAPAAARRRCEVAANALARVPGVLKAADAAPCAHSAAQLTRDELDVYLCTPQPQQPAAPPPPLPPGRESPPRQSEPQPAPWGSPVPIVATLPPGASQKPHAPSGAACMPASDSPEGVLFVGVRPEKNGKWRAEIRLPQENAAAGEAPKRGKMKCLGSFNTAAEAAAAYDAAARLAGRTVVNVPSRPGETRAVKQRKRERPPQKPQPAAASPGGFPALDAQRRALTAASAQAALRPAVPLVASPDDAAPAAKLQRVAVAAAAPPALGVAVSAAQLGTQRAAAPGDDELGVALARHGLGSLAPRFAAERIDAELLRAAGSDLLRGREAQERLGVTTLGDAMRLSLVLKALGVTWDGA